jgi:mRNA-degrading endonuclease toxin of MazEF toxin-antitoxin module
VIPVFSTGRLGPTRVPVPAGVGGLRRPGVLFCEEIATVDRDFLVRGPLGGELPERLLRQIVFAVRRALGDLVVDAQDLGIGRPEVGDLTDTTIRAGRIA